MRLILFMGTGFLIGQTVQHLAIAYGFDPVAAQFACMPICVVLAVKTSRWLRARRDRLSSPREP
jgi:hypothetical protein